MIFTKRNSDGVRKLNKRAKQKQDDGKGRWIRLQLVLVNEPLGPYKQRIIHGG